ncbi:MAG: T9SS type A sorting domain-containing protein [Bacteroidales bacterium]
MDHIRRFFVITVSLLIFVFSASAQDPGFFLDDWQEKTAEIPQYEEMTKPTTAPTFTITADFDQKLRKVPKYVYGNNAVTWNNEIRYNATAVKDINNLNPHVLRFPGGNLSNEFFWNLSDGQRPSDIPSNINTWEGMNTASWQMGVDDYYQFLEQTNCVGQICVNYSYARYGTGPDPVAKAAHMAAEWVRYDKGRTKFWEIGNENFGNWQAGYEIDTDLNQDGQPRFINGELYGQHCKIFMDSMRAAAAETGADIKIGIVVYDAEDSWDPISAVWNEGVLPVVGDLADFLVVHNYYTPYDEDSPVSTILNSYTRTEEFMEVLESDMQEAGKPMLPVAMTEWNIFAVGSMQQVSYINGMHSALLLGEFIKHGYGLSNRWDLVNGWNNGDDHGMFSVGGEPGVDPYNPRPAFFYMYYFQKYFGDQMIQCSHEGGKDIVAYASSFSSGETGLVIVNKSRNAETAKIDIQNLIPGYRYYTMTLTGGDDNGDFSRKVRLNGISTDEQGGGPDTYESIKAFSARTSGGIKVKLPALSVVYVMVDKNEPLSYITSYMESNPSVITLELSDDLMPVEDISGFEVSINGSSIGIEDVNVDTEFPNRLNIHLDTEILSTDNISLSYSGSGVMSVSGSTLTDFSDEIVENRLPDEYYTVTFLAKDSETGDSIEGCLVSFNFEESFTAMDGRAEFTSSQGNYILSVSGTHLSSIENMPVEISSDTLIEIAMDSAVYMVDFQLINQVTGNDLYGVEISSGDEIVTTNTSGKGIFNRKHGEYDFTFTADKFFEENRSFEINSDTSFEIALKPSHVEVTFIVKNESQPLRNVLVILNDDSLSTNYLGICKFRDVSVNNTYEYKIEKEYYEGYSGQIEVLADTSLELQMKKLVANIHFIVEGESDDPGNSYVVIDQDTSWCNAEGETRFYNYDLYLNYDYRVISDKYPEYTGSLLLGNDTTVNILLQMTDVGLYENTSISLYPNPATDRITIKSQSSPVHKISIWNMEGKLVYSKKSDSGHRSIEIDIDFPAGLYFIEMGLDDKVVYNKFVVRR